MGSSLIPVTMWRYTTVFATLVLGSSAGLLGAGEGEGSCAAAPFRTDEADLKWKSGCPGWAPCCSEYGYCQPKASWEAGLFRDCNGESNGTPLPAETLAAEAAASGKSTATAAVAEAIVPGYDTPAVVVPEAREVAPAPTVVVQAAPVPVLAVAAPLPIAAPPLPISALLPATPLHTPLNVMTPPLRSFYLPPAEASVEVPSTLYGAPALPVYGK